MYVACFEMLFVVCLKARPPPPPPPVLQVLLKDLLKLYKPKAYKQKFTISRAMPMFKISLVFKIRI